MSEQPEPPAYTRLVEQLLTDPSVSESQMMGMASLKANGRMFGGCFAGMLVVKVGRERAHELIESGRAHPFDPSGRRRPMKDWAQVPEPEDVWLGLAREALELIDRG